MNKNYKHLTTLRQLDDIDFTLVTDSQDLTFWLEFIAMPKKYHKDITGIVAHTYEGDLIAMWLTEDNAPYSDNGHYHPLPFYRPKSWIKRNLPSYWLEDNEEYLK
jgi:hypothetical protein